MPRNAFACPFTPGCGRLNRTNQPALAAAELPTSWPSNWGVRVMKRQHTLKKLAELKPELTERFGVTRLALF
ncbi:MAG: hypothetical protein WBM67_04835, partial [Sedimenticolaceae bacterium]